MSDIPHYFLYGEATSTNALTYLHIASLEDSLPKHNWEIHPHRHNNLHQLLIIEQGSVLARVNDKSSEEHGPCILSIPPKEAHGFVHQPNVKGYIVTIQRPFLLNLFSENEREEFPHLLRTPLMARPQPDSQTAWTIENVAPQLFAEYNNSEVGQASMIGAYVKILFTLIQRSQETGSSKAHGFHEDDQSGKPHDFRISNHEQFMELLESHYLEHWTVDQYAEKLGLSGGRLNRLCKKYSDQKALEVIHDRLITEAKRQLIYTQLSAKEISYKLGFKDPGYFSRFFSRKVGFTPGKFKQQVHEQRRNA